MSDFSYGEAVLLWLAAMFMLPDSSVHNWPVWFQWTSIAVAIFICLLDNARVKANRAKFLEEVKNAKTINS